MADGFWRAHYKRTGDYYEGHIGLGCLLVAFLALVLAIAVLAVLAAVLNG